MEKLIKIVLAWMGAKEASKGRCGCFGFIFFFIIIYWLLGYVFKVF